MGFNLPSKIRTTKSLQSLSISKKKQHETTTNSKKTRSSSLLHSVSLGCGNFPTMSSAASGTITPPLTPIDDDDEEESQRQRAEVVQTFNSKQKTASLNDVSKQLPNNRSDVKLRICGKTTQDDRTPLNFSNSEEYPIGIPFEIETDLFVGKMLLRVKGLRNSNDPNGDDYFKGRCRTYQHVIQGRFKEEISFSDFQSGYEMHYPLKKLPPQPILKLCISLAKKLAPGITISVHTDKQSFFSGNMSASKIVRADKPGEEVDITSHNIKEDCTLFGGEFTKGNITSRRRRKILSDPAKLKQYKFDTETIYTFDFYEFIADITSWSLPLGFVHLDLETILGRQPIVWVGKTGERYIWQGSLIHKKILSDQHSSEEDEVEEEDEEDDLIED